MLSRQDVIAACLRLPGAFEDYPFDDPNWTVMRHGSNYKSFAFIFERDGKIWINLKVQPLNGDFWKSVYPAVRPAYHMNKRHWISVVLDGSMSDAEILPLIEDSFQLTAPPAMRSPSS